jgi:hypothetical protein
MMPLDIALFAGAAAVFLAAVVAAVVAWRGEGSLLAMGDAPTLSIAEAIERQRRIRSGALPFGDAVEVVGSVECDTPLRAPYSEQLCLAYDYNVSEEHEQRVGGRRGLSRGRELETHAFDAQGRRVPRFYVRDTTGRIAVETAGATLDMLETVARYEEYTGLGGREREIWREERALPLDRPVYVLGYLGDLGGEPALMRHPLHKGRRFIISYRDERALGAATRRRAYGLYLASGLGLGASAALIALALIV